MYLYVLQKLHKLTEMFAFIFTLIITEINEKFKISMENNQEQKVTFALDLLSSCGWQCQQMITVSRYGFSWFFF